MLLAFRDKICSNIAFIFKVVLSFLLILICLFSFQFTNANLCLGAVENSNATIPASQYTFAISRSRAKYVEMLGTRFEQKVRKTMAKGGVIVDSGAGFGLVAFEFAQVSRVTSVAISYQDFWSELFQGEAFYGELWYKKIDVLDLLGLEGDVVDRQQIADAFDRKVAALKGKFIYEAGQFSENLLTTKYNGQADLIMSVVGDYSYSADRVGVIKSHITALKGGGSSFITNTKSRYGDRDIHIVDYKGKDVELEVLLHEMFPMVFPKVEKNSQVILQINRIKDEKLILNVFDFLDKIHFVRVQKDSNQYYRKNVPFERSFYTFQSE